MMSPPSPSPTLGLPTMQPKRLFTTEFRSHWIDVVTGQRYQERYSQRRNPNIQPVLNIAELQDYVHQDLDDDFIHYAKIVLANQDKPGEGGSWIIFYKLVREITDHMSIWKEPNRQLATTIKSKYPSA